MVVHQSLVSGRQSSIYSLQLLDLDVGSTKSGSEVVQLVLESSVIPADGFSLVGLLPEQLSQTGPLILESTAESVRVGLELNKAIDLLCRETDQLSNLT
jgi:hypothetical protein